MHTVATYTMRSISKSNLSRVDSSDSNERFAYLQNIGGSDLFDLLKDFISSVSTNFITNSEEKVVYSFDAMVYDRKARVICGWFQLGNYGSKSPVIDVESKKLAFQMLKTSANVKSHFVYFYVPVEKKEAICLMHAYKGNGVKTLFLSIFSDYFGRKTHHHLQMKPLSYKKAFDHWLEGNTKEIRLVGYKQKDDPADRLNVKNVESTMSIKAPRRGTLGSLKQMITPGTEQNEAIKLMSPLCSQVKTIIQFGDHKKTFNIGYTLEDQICEIELPESLINVEDGNLDFAKTKSWCDQTSGEYAKRIY